MDNRAEKPFHMLERQREEPTRLKSETLRARLERTLEGAFTRKYRDQRGNALDTQLEWAMSKLLRFTGTRYRYKPRIRLKDGSSIVPTFATRTGVIFVPSGATANETSQMVFNLRRLRPHSNVLVVSAPSLRHDYEELGLAAITLNPEEHAFEDNRAIFLDDPSFAFDYSHILPTATKCSVLHGHTSAVLIELVGQTKDGVIIDFAEAKRIIRTALAKLDHKLFIAKKYVVGTNGATYHIRFKGPKGEFDLKVPKATTFLMEGQATTENLAEEVVRLLLPRMPPNIAAVGAYVYEGLNKGAHLLAVAPSRRRDAS